MHPPLFNRTPHEAARLVRGLIQLQSSGGDLWSSMLLLYMSVSGERERQKREAASRACLGAPQGNGIIQYYTDSSGKRSALQHCSSSSSGHPGRLWAIIGPDLWDDRKLTHQCLLNAGVNMPKELSSRGFLRCTAVSRSECTSWRSPQVMFGL